MKPKHRALELEAKAFNQRFAQIRVKVEHRIRSLKVFRTLKGVYRGRRRRLDLRLQLIAGWPLNYFRKRSIYLQHFLYKA
ncbi:MAG: hypothetical protein E6Q83_16135 [Thiothrix sp.]|nr:MAG: hypothetical protein E6Q83_16135 [Thiothrix sp.]